jgi:hypothetical protein
MAAFSTTVQKLGVNAIYNSTSGGQIGFSTATSSVTLTHGALEDVVLFWYNHTDVDNVTCTISATTNTFYASRGRGNLVISTALNSSNYGFIGQLESAWFQSTANAVTFTFSTTITVGAIELSSTRQN